MTVQPRASAKAFKMALLPVTWEIFTASRRPSFAAPASRISLARLDGFFSISNATTLVLPGYPRTAASAAATTSVILKIPFEI